MAKYAIPMKRSTWRVVPPGTYVLRLVDVRDGPTFQNKRGEDEPTIKLVLTVDRGPQKGMELSALMNPAATGPKSNTRRWAEALSGEDFGDDELFDPEAYIDALVSAKVDVVPDGQGIERNKIDIVMGLGALEAQLAGTPGGASPRPAPTARGPRLGAGLEGPDRELQLPETPGDDPGWHAMQPPPADAAEASY